MCECEENLSRFIKCQMYSNVKSISIFGFMKGEMKVMLHDVTSVVKILKSSQVNLMLEGLWLGCL